MNDQAAQNETGIIVAVLERLRDYAIPRALDLKAKVEAGGTLDTFDIQFLEEALADTRDMQPGLERHPEYEEIVGKMIHLYHEITERALANEGTGQTP